MGNASDSPVQQTHGTIRFTTPDLSVPAHDRGLFAFPANKTVADQRLVLHDFRSDATLLQGRDALDTYGFTYVKHQSVLSESGDPATDWYHGTNVEDIYIPEVVKLVCDLTGAKSAVVNNIAFRRRLAKEQEDKSFYNKRGSPLDQELGKIPRDVTLVYGKEASGSLEPGRMAHIDYTLRALRDSARYCRHDIKEAAQDALNAEDSSASSPDHNTATTESIPRYAVFSVWRPVRPVLRDPLAVCDMRTVYPADCAVSSYRALSDITASGEYMMEAVVLGPPTHPNRQKWYWFPRQQPDEVLVIKFADTAETDSNSNKVLDGICGAGGAPHCSPVVEGVDPETEPRYSIEARVLAFW